MVIIINFRVWLFLCILLVFGDFFFLLIDDFLYVFLYFDLLKKKNKVVKFLFNNMNLNVMLYIYF